jgi:hypothetical protein
LISRGWVIESIEDAVRQNREQTADLRSSPISDTSYSRN